MLIWDDYRTPYILLIGSISIGIILIYWFLNSILLIESQLTSEFLMVYLLAILGAVLSFFLHGFYLEIFAESEPPPTPALLRVPRHNIRLSGHITTSKR